MVKSLNKVFSTFVAMMTVASTVSGVFAPGVASAAMAGDLLKASGPAVYYFAADGKRYVFPNEKTYFSWYTDFSSVKTISDSELASYPIGGNVTIRPGTKLVKIQTDPKVYAVTQCGVLHWIESATIAESLYGSAWASRVVDVPDAFFVNYTIGSSVASAVHPDGQTITYAGDSSNYVVMNGQKRKFASQAAWDANMENAANSIMTTISYPSGADVVGREAALADVVCGVSTPVGGNLVVSLASDTPAGMTVPKNASSVPLAKYTFTAGSGDAMITGLTIHRVGIGSASDLSAIYLYDQNGVRITTGRTINSQSNTATFSSVNLTIPAGGSKSVYLYGDFSTPSTTGGQHSFEILDAASVVVSAGTVSGSFPVRGNVFTVGVTSAARVDVQKGATPANPNVGAKNVEISNFKLVANTNEVLVNQVTLYQAGSVTNSDLSNLKLYQGAALVAQASGIDSNGRITLKFISPYSITSGTTKVFSLRADVGGRSGRTIRTYVEYTTDVNAMDKTTVSGAAICIASTATGGCTSTGQGSFDGTSTNYIEITTQGGTLTNAFNGPATSNVAKGSLAVPLYKFALTAQNNLEVRNVRFSIDKTAGSGCYVRGTGTGSALDGTMYFRTIKLIDTDSGSTVMGPIEMSSSGLADQSTGSGSLVFTDTFPISAGQTKNLAIVSDLSNSEDNTGEFFGNGTCGYKATLSAFQSNDVRMTDTGEYLALTQIIPNSSVQGNQVNVKTSSLDITLAGTPSSDTVVKKAQNFPVAGLVLTSGSQSDTLITSVSLTCQGKLVGRYAFNTAGALADCISRITSLSLWDGSTQVGTAMAPDTTTGKAQISNMNFTVPAGTSKSLTVAATFGSTASTTAPYDQVAVGIAATGDVQAQDNQSNSITPSLGTTLTGQTGASPSVVMTVLNTGTITYSADANPQSTIVVAGKDVWVPFAQYKAVASFESMQIDNIAVLASSTAGFSGDNSIFSSVAVASNGAVKGQNILSGGTTGTKDIDLSANPIVVPKNGSVTFQLWGKLNHVQSSSTATNVPRSGMGVALGLKSSLTTGDWDSNYSGNLNIRATGLSSGDRVYNAGTNATHGNSMVVRKTVPTVTKQSLSSTTLANIDQDLMKFQVSADAQGSVAVKQVVFSVSKTSGLTLTNFRLRKGSSDMNPTDYSVTYSSSTGVASDVQTGSIDTTQNSGYLVVAFTNEETVTGSGNVYTLHATVSGAASGQNLSLSFYRDPSNTVATGYLKNSTTAGVLAASSANIYQINTDAAPGSTVTVGTFVWSDLSEVNHSYAVGASGGSRDWTNDVFVGDLTQTQTINL